MKLKLEDIKIDICRRLVSHGRTRIYAKVTHKPTGLVVECSGFRSTHANQSAAISELRKKVEALPEPKPKPHIYWQYCPKSKRGYWKVSLMPKPFKPEYHLPWQNAHFFAEKLNDRIAYKEYSNV